MGRILIRKRKPLTFGSGQDSLSISGEPNPYVGNIDFTPEPITGEPDPTDINAAADNNGPNGAGKSDSGPDSGRGGGDSNFIDPTSATDPGTGTRPRRGRKPGSRNKATRTTATQTTQDLTSILLT